MNKPTFLEISLNTLQYLGKRSRKLGIIALLAVCLVVYTSPGVRATSCNTTGVTKNPNGTFSFAALHVDTNGSIVDGSGCVVKLVGVNYGWLDSDAANTGSASDIAKWKVAIPMNVVRIALNSYWYNNGATAPNYQNQTIASLLDQFIKIQQAAGNYVELDVAEQFPEGPCMSNGSRGCPSQSQYASDYKKGGPSCPTSWPEGWVFGDSDPAAGNISTVCPAAREVEAYQPIPQQALATLAQKYGSNPGIIFDVWNESLSTNPEGMSHSQFYEAMNARIAIVRKHSNNIIVAFGHDIKQDIQSPFQGSNIVVDYHTYTTSFDGSNVKAELVPSFRAHGQGFIINEYGGSTDYSSTVAAAMTDLGTNDNVGSLYFGIWNLVNDTKADPLVLNTDGQMVQATDKAILGSNGYNTQNQNNQKLPTFSTTSYVLVHDRKDVPVSGATITFSTTGGAISATTDANGKAFIPTADALLTQVRVATEVFSEDLHTHDGTNYTLTLNLQSKTIAHSKGFWLYLVLAAASVLVVVFGFLAWRYAAKRKKSTTDAPQLPDNHQQHETNNDIHSVRDDKPDKNS